MVLSMILTNTLSGFNQKILESPGAYHALDCFSETQVNHGPRRPDATDLARDNSPPES